MKPSSDENLLVVMILQIRGMTLLPVDQESSCVTHEPEPT